MGFRIDTERLQIREWADADFEAFREIATNSSVMRFISDGQAWTDDQIRDFFGRQARHAAEHGFCLGALVGRDDGELLGLAGLQPLGTTADVEIGWWLHPERWGQGLATEAGRGAVGFAFQAMRLRRVVAIAHPGNRASLRVMEKLGMRFDRHARGADLGLRQPDVEVSFYTRDNPDVRGAKGGQTPARRNPPH